MFTVFCRVVILAVVLLGSHATRAAGPAVHRISSASIALTRHGVSPITHGWRFRAGDDLARARPEHDDGTWAAAAAGPMGIIASEEGWAGVGWFRIRVQISPSLRGKRLALYMRRLGAAEVYLDGELLVRQGDVASCLDGHGTPADLTWNSHVPITFDDDDVHVLAIRFASRQLRRLSRVGLRGTVSISIADPLVSVPYWNEMRKKAIRLNFLFIGAASALAVLHMLLFLFYRDRRGNLYYAAAAAAVVMTAYSSTKMFDMDSAGWILALAGIFGASIVAVCVALLRFYYEVFTPRVPRRFWVIVAVAAPLFVLSWTLPRWAIYIFGSVVLVEQFRVLIAAMIRRESGAWIIGMGGGAWIIGAALQMLGDSKLIDAPHFSYLFGFMGLLGSISVFLARAAARDKDELARRLVKIQALSEATLEQERRARSEEMARKVLEAANARKELKLRSKELKLKEAEKREAMLQELEVAYRELRATQAQLVQSEKMASLGQLVAGVSHEVNTPLGAIRSASDSLARALAKLEDTIDGPLPDARKKHHKLDLALRAMEDATGVVASGSERISEIITRLRSFARLDEASFKRIDIRQGLEDALVLLSNQLTDKIKIVRELRDVPMITCNPRQLNQVFFNLLLNARQAIEDRGQIVVSTATRDDEILVEIRDDGAGIRPDALSRIFDPGFTTQGVGVGAGLGLPICYRIIKEHQGEIRVDSEVGRGTTVTVILPIVIDGP